MEVFLVFSTLIRTFVIDLGIFSHYDKKIRMKRVIAILLLTAGVLGAIRGTDFRHDISQLKNVIERDSAQAFNTAERLLKRDRKNPDLAAAIGQTFLKANRLADAEYFYDKGYHMYRISPTVINLAGDIALAKNDFKQAEYHYGRAIYFDRRSPEGYFKLASLYAKDDPEKAVSTLKALKCYRRYTAIDLRIANIYYGANQFSEAARTYAALPPDSLGKEDVTNYALSYYFQQQFDSALAVTRQAVPRFPRHPAVNRMLLYNLTELKQYDEALDAARKLFHESDKAEYQYLDYIYYGYALNGKGRYDDAIAQFNKVMELNPDRKDVAKAISDAYEKIGDYSHAIEYYQLYVNRLDDAEKSPYDEFHIGNLYYALGTDSKDGKELTPDKIQALHEADRQFMKVDQMRPDSYLGTYWRARTNVALDPETKQGLARPYYMKVIEMTEGKSGQQQQLMESYKYMAYYYYCKRDKTGCLVYVDKILDINPTDNYALQLSGAL